jgi:phosphate-selective porin
MRALHFLLATATLALTFTATARAETPLQSYWDNDFVLASEDDAFHLNVRGNVHFDTRFYQGESVGAPDSFDLRRARIDLRGRVHRWFTFRVQPELAGHPYIRNAWMDAGPVDLFHVRAGQMKVPLSSSWLTLDNNINFIERATSTPLHPFFDRGLLLWGELLGGVSIYDFGVFTGAGTDSDYTAGDVDNHPEFAGRLLLQPFRTVDCKPLQGVYLAAAETYAKMTVPTSRYELGGLRSANYETAIWRWRTNQTFGTDGRVTDRVAARIGSRSRVVGEVHYLLGPFALSAEYLRLHYRDINVYHDLMVGSSRRAHQRLFQTSGTIRSLSVWASVYVTGESNKLVHEGWKTAKPKGNVGEGGCGAIEVLGRYSRTDTDRELFRSRSVSGFAPSSRALPAGYAEGAPGAAHSLQVAVLDGAHAVHEATFGVSWTLNPMVKLLLNDVLLWAPSDDRDGDGESDNYLLSGAKSDQADPNLSGHKTSWENAVMGRFILKL